MTTPPPANPYGTPTGQSSYPTPPPKPQKKKWPWIVGGVAAVFILLIIIGAVSGSNDNKDTNTNAAATSTVTTVTQTEQATTSTVTSTATATPSTPTVKTLTVPDGLVGTNAQLAFEKLQDLGFTKITPSSTDESASVPVLLSNWTVTGVEPGPGTSMKSDSTIILKMSKD